MIPRNIHFIWYQGWNSFPYDKYGENIEQTKILNPEWTVFYWDNDSIRNELKKLGQQYLDKYDSFKVMHQKIDFARYSAALYRYGGISVDVDAKALKPFNQIPFINERDLITGFNGVDAVGRLVQQGNTRKTINNSVILASKHHPILKEVIDHILTLDCKENQSDFSCVLDTTSKSLNDILYKHKDEIIILDNSYFNACHAADDYCEIPQNAIIEQENAQTWVPKSHQALAKAYYWLKEHRLWIVGIIGLILLVSFSRKTQTS